MLSGSKGEGTGGTTHLERSAIAGAVAGGKDQAIGICQFWSMY